MGQFIRFEEITKEGLERTFNFNELVKKWIHYDVCEILEKESFLLKDIYTYCFYNNECSIKEYLEKQKTSDVENVEDFMQQATQKIESAIQLCANKTKEEFAADDNDFLFSVKRCDKETIKCIIDYLTSLSQQGLNPNIAIHQDSHKFDKEEILNLMDFREFLQKDFEVNEIRNAQFGKKEGWSGFRVSFDKTIEAHQKMEEEIKIIEDLNLSPFEKFLYVHDFVASKIYKHVPGDKSSVKSRTFADTMTGDYIVCVGYAAILERFCNRLGIDCRRISGQSTIKGEPGHDANVVKIIDEKYGINGEYFCDTCFGSKKNDYDFNKHYFYAALPLQDIQYIKQSEFFNDVLAGYEGEKESKPIPIKAFQQALTSLYSQIEGKNFDANKVRSNLKRSIMIAEEANALDGENAFSASRNNFKKISKEISNGEKLEYKQLKYIFKNLNVKDDLSETILRLLNELDEKRKNRLINTINKHFKFDNLTDSFTYECKNKLVIPGIYLLDKTIDKQNVQEAANIESDELKC